MRSRAVWSRAAAPRRGPSADTSRRAPGEGKRSPAATSIPRLPSATPSLFPIQDRVDRSAGYRMVRGARPLVNFPGPLLPLHILGQLPEERFEELAAALADQEAL